MTTPAPHPTPAAPDVRHEGDTMSRVVDLTGQRFAYLTVIERAPSHRTAGGQVKTRWKCRCDCGAEVVTQAATLKAAQVRSCGCLRLRENRDRRMTELVGARSGRLTALRVVEMKHDTFIWECQCDCGQTVNVRGTAIRKQTTQSCGCLSSELSTVRGRREVLTYMHVHDRMRALSGPAHERLCVDCGQQAREWSYIGGDPDELTCPSTGMKYSTSPARYAPRCRECHARHDARVRREVTEQSA